MNERKEIKFIDLFSGIGGFHYGLTRHKESTGYKCVWANEWDKYASAVYRYQFPETHLSTKDIKTISENDIPDHDILCAGFPCQSFSITGKRAGLDDIRGTLFYDIVRIAEYKKPSILFLENVKGLLNHDSGHTFRIIMEILGSIGYRLEWQTFNTYWFGVPQHRERVFIIGYLRERTAGKIFPITEIGGGTNNEYAKGTEEYGWDRYGTRTDISKREQNRHIGLVQIANLYSSHSDAGRVYSIDGVARTLKSESGGLGGKNGLYLVSTNPMRVRRLTPIECERVQGFPDNWTSYGCFGGLNKSLSDSQRYKMLGNSLTTNIIYVLGRRLKNIENVIH